MYNLHKLFLSLLVGWSFFFRGLCIAAPAVPEKVGFVNVAEVFRRVPSAVKAQEKLQEEGRKKTSQFEERDRKLQEKHANYLKRQPALTEKKRREEEEALQKEMMQMRRDYQEWQEGAMRQQRSELKPIHDRLKQASSQVAQQKSFGIILAKPNDEEDSSVLYYHPSLDLTDEVISNLKELEGNTKTPLK